MAIAVVRVVQAPHRIHGAIARNSSCRERAPKMMEIRGLPITVVHTVTPT
jgi:hypothetical protein